MGFRIIGLQSDQFSHLIARDDATLAQFDAERHHISMEHVAPCRITLDDVPKGETAVLVSYEHQGAQTPYRQSGPIYLSEAGAQHWDKVDEIPPAMKRRTLSVRGFDGTGNMIEAEVVEGASLDDCINTFFVNQSVAEIHIHYARRGCFGARAVRA